MPAWLKLATTPNLEQLSLRKLNLSDAALATFRAALPNCKIQR